VGNYNITYVNGTLTVNPAPLTITADAASMTYGGAIPVLTYNPSGFVNGDTSSVLSGEPSLTTAATGSSPVGGYTITVALGSLTAANYTFSGFVNGTLMVSQAPLTVTADSYVRPYGAPLPSYEGSLIGVVNGDAITAVYSGPTVAGCDVGSYTIVPSLLDPGGRLANYTVAFDTGTLSITQIPPSVSASDAGGSYANLPYPASGTVTGLNSVGLGPLSYLYYNGANVTTSSAPPLASPPVNAGTYTVLALYAGSLDYAAASNVATFTIGQAVATVALAAPPAALTADGSNDVTNWVEATVTGASGAPAPTGGVAFTYYAGSSAGGAPLSASPIVAGTYTVVANYGGNSNYLPATSSPVSFTISAPASPVNVSSFQVNDGSAQRSMVESLTVTFNAPVTLAAGAITLETQSGTAVAFSLSPAAGPSATYVLSFSGSQFVGGSLANGQYVLTVNHSLVSSSGGAMTADQSFSFFRLFGDYNGDGSVNNADYTVFKKAYGAAVGSAAYNTYWYFDYYFDDYLNPGATINASDLTEFLDDYGTSI
jgi:hypothetical protein